jgi:hypothetical protein
MSETSPVDGGEFTQNADVGIARSFGLQPDFKTPTVGKLFNVPIEVVDINDHFASSQGVDTSSETSLGGCPGKIIAENIDGRRHFHYCFILPLAEGAFAISRVASGVLNSW